MEKKSFEPISDNLQTCSAQKHVIV